MTEQDYDVPDGIGDLTIEREGRTEVQETKGLEEEKSAKKRSCEKAQKKQYAFRLDDKVAKQLVEIEFFYKMHGDLNISRSELVSEAIELRHKKMLRQKKKIENQDD